MEEIKENEKLNKDVEEVKELDETTRKQIQRLLDASSQAPFYQQPVLLDKYEMAKLKVREMLESLLKYSSYYIRKTEERFGLRIEFATSIRYNEYGMPALIIEILDIHYAEDLPTKKPSREKKGKEKTVEK